MQRRTYWSMYFLILIALIAITSICFGLQRIVLGGPKPILPTIDRWGLPTTDGVNVGGYIHSYDGMTRCPRWTLERINQENLREEIGVERSDYFKEDKAIPEEFRSTLEDYKKSGWSRGHQAPSDNYMIDQGQNNATFFLSNMVPQNQAMNNGVWKKLEIWKRNLARTGVLQNNEWISVQLWSVVVPLWLRDQSSPKQIKVELCGNVWVPTHLGCTALVQYRDNIDLYAWIIPNSEAVAKDPPDKFRVSVDDLERAAGLDFWKFLDYNTQKKLEAAVP